ncbi:hypothetical protein LAZ67_19001174 [Cordylochernes scorpioides]|uniref:Uncharacterized protein n=1 Tax=Cordylochernes scorpioides TaxID=51811 RepID=A0ABY6LL96_9ARAC|nr:hypothetical protein LAZ67_19001174 [Cordylochernes scorpioides]
MSTAKLTLVHQVIKCKAAIVPKFGDRLVVDEVEVAPPQKEEVRIKVSTVPLECNIKNKNAYPDQEHMCFLDGRAPSSGTKINKKKTIDLTRYIWPTYFLDKSKNEIHECVLRCWRSSAWSSLYH